MDNKTKNKVILLVCIITAGIVSRVIKTNIEIFDKYLGDLLYAAMFYVIFDLVFKKSAKFTIITTFTFMIILEFFQLTLIPLSITESNSVIIKIIGILIGTEFNLKDIIAYTIGIVSISLLYSKSHYL